MAAHERLELIRVKLERAKEHRTTLTTLVREYLNTKPYSVGVKRNELTRRLIYFVTEIHPTPATISAVLGDTIHNLRSSLDHLAYQLVWLGTGSTPTNHVYFPIADDQAKYLEKRSHQLKGSTAAAMAAVDELLPYRGGNDLLWQLHQLNNIDKHRILITSGTAFQSIDVGPLLHRQMENLHKESSMAEMYARLPTFEVFIRPAVRMFPLKVGAELFIDVPDAKPHDKIQFRFDVAFGEQDVLFGVPIIETLDSFIRFVEDILQKFERHLK